MTPEQLFDEFGLAQNEVLLRLTTSPYEELARDLDGLERRFTADAPDADTALAVRRWVAEWQLMVALAHERDIAECERLMVAVEALGYESLLGQVHIVPAFCRYCLDHGRADLGIARLASLLADVEREEATGHPPWTPETVEFLRKLAAELRA